MPTQIKGAVPPAVAIHMLDVYRSVTNQIVTNGITRDRFYPSTVGHFIAADFTEQEFSPLLPYIHTAIPSLTSVAVCRILKYNTHCHINRHVDAQFRTDSNVSIIVQLVPPSDYTGGEIIVNKQLVTLDHGDIVYYSYDDVHEVKPIKSGVRYVANIRGLITK